jgi:hypothetical protein
MDHDDAAEIAGIRNGASLPRLHRKKYAVGDIPNTKLIPEEIRLQKQFYAHAQNGRHGLLVINCSIT